MILAIYNAPDRDCFSLFHLFSEAEKYVCQCILNDQSSSDFLSEEDLDLRENILQGKYSYAIDLYNHYNAKQGTYHLQKINVKYFSGDVILLAKEEMTESVPKLQSAVQVDDHTCINCQNTKCSKTEKSCWKCGAAI